MNIYHQSLLSIINNKYIRTYLAICQQAKLRADSRLDAKRITGKYVERHHIIPVSFKLGGQKDNSNLVFLTGREHYLCHMLLYFGFKNSETHYFYKCKHAFGAFRCNKAGRELTSAQYEYVKSLDNRIGENHTMAKLTDALAKEIKVRYKTEPISSKELGKQYGIGASTVDDIVRNRAWTHVEGMLDLDKLIKPKIIIKSSFSNLTPDQIRMIRYRYKTENISQTNLGNDFGLGRSIICQIINYQLFGHVKDEVDLSAIIKPTRYLTRD